MVKIKRAYEKPARDDGYRVLVDRLWPRGISKRKAGIDLWLQDVAPSRELRQWFGHDPERWSEFRKRYRQELREGEGAAALRQLRAQARKGPVTLVYGARDEEHNNAVVLGQLLKPRRTSTPAKRRAKP